MQLLLPPVMAVVPLRRVAAVLAGLAGVDKRQVVHFMTEHARAPRLAVVADLEILKPENLHRLVSERDEPSRFCLGLFRFQRRVAVVCEPQSVGR